MFQQQVVFEMQSLEGPEVCSCCMKRARCPRFLFSSPRIVKTMKPFPGKLCICCVVLFAVAIGVRRSNAQDLAVLPTSAAQSGDTSEKIELGKMLYFDPRLSRTGTVSCNTCHNLMEGGDDARATSMGVDGLTGPRNAPTVWNSVFQGSQFWDGRAPTLEEQAKGPMVADVEMGMVGHDQVLSRIEKIPGYVTAFRDVFGPHDPVSITNAVEAIAAFERTLITPNAPLDRYLGGDENALSDAQIRGMELFESVGCTECHYGPALNGWEPGDDAEFLDFPRFTESELIEKYDLVSDKGRSASSGDPGDDHYFKVPTLRNITVTAPYFHNGQVETLADAIRVMAITQVDEELTDQQVADLESFMKSLEGRFPEIVLPRLPTKSGATVVR
ncbi:cytochrome c551 peroxidase [Rhodopirellula sallentina SM41]|uniref:Cytochrome c551 peroxidase n=1 Tax=Rhodopirellula sallentina SM41 TaxID=1263870 RepID=M5U7B5_9BACT|nr:cytochrome c551 peroxidase [Rhodopirellula sallentina SM41]